MGSPLISDHVRYKVDHCKFYFIKVDWRHILKCDPTTFEYVNKEQAKSVIRALMNNPFVNDIMVYDNEGNTKHFQPVYDEKFAYELMADLHAFCKDANPEDFKCRTNQYWQKILTERKARLKEALLEDSNRKCKFYKGKLMIKGVNCMLGGSIRADGAEFPPDCESWWNE